MPLSPDELLTTTRAVRRRLDFERPVPRALVEECLEIALQAPNGSNRNAWHWVALDDRERIARIAELYRAAIVDQVAHPAAAFGDVSSVPGHERLMHSAQYLAENLHRSPVLLVPLIDGRTEGENLFVRASLWASVIPAVWSFMLALRARGLGSVWTTLTLVREAEMAEILAVPRERYTQVGLFPVAYTLGTEFKRAWRQPLSEVLSWNQM
jgi:nitroreductase